MKKSTRNQSLEIEVSDFGPIAEATIDLLLLTLFVGPSYTGKSYLAILVYALHRAFNRGASLLGRRLCAGLPYYTSRNGRKISQEVLDSLKTVAKMLDTDLESKGERRVVLPAPSAEELRVGFDGLTDLLVGEIERCFEVEKSTSLLEWVGEADARFQYDEKCRTRRGPRSTGLLHHECRSLEAWFLRKFRFRSNWNQREG